MRVSEAMNAAGINVEGNPIEEGMLRAKCQACGAEHALEDVDVRSSGLQTDYLCSCGVVFVTVGPAPGLEGYRLKDNVVNPLGGMYIDVPPSA